MERAAFGSRDLDDDLLEQRAQTGLGLLVRLYPAGIGEDEKTIGDSLHALEQRQRRVQDFVAIFRSEQRQADGRHERGFEVERVGRGDGAIENVARRRSKAGPVEDAIIGIQATISRHSRDPSDAISPRASDS